MHGDFLYSKYGGILLRTDFIIQDIAHVQNVDALIGEFYFQKWPILCFNRITNPDSFE